MEASPESRLEALRQRSIQAARIRLSANYELESVDPGPNYVEAWKLKVSLSITEFLIVKIPRQFPFVLPHIYLAQRDLFGVISHINRDGQFCYLEQGAVTYETDRIADVVEDAVARTISALKNPEALQLEDEFRKELFAYIETKGSFLSLLGDYETPRLVSLTTTDKNIEDFKFVVSESEDEATRWLDRTGIAKSESTSKAIFLPEGIVGRPPFAVTLKDLVSQLKTTSPEHYAFFVKCYRQVDTCITTVKSSLGATVLAWRYSNSRFSDPGRSPKVSGFRPGKYPPEAELASGFAETGVEYLKGERIDLERLTKRTDPDVLAVEDRRVVVVGLGAIGSHLTRMLPKVAVCSKVTLFDKETLGLENILRHSISFRFVGYSKSLITAFESQSHAPWTDFESFKDAILELDEFERVCKDASLVILATGSERLDRFLSDVAYSHLSPGGTIVQTWLEERADAGHAVCYVKGSGACPSCGHVRRKTIDLSMGTQEPGCNASYANYGGSRLQRFCATAIDYMIHTKQTVAVEWTARTDDAFSVDTCRVHELKGGECEKCGA